MSELNLNLLDGSAFKFLPREVGPIRPLEEVLVERGFVTNDVLIRTKRSVRGMEIGLGDVLVLEGTISERELVNCRAEQHGLAHVELSIHAPDASLAELLPTELCLRHVALPWMRMGNILMVAVPEPERLDKIRGEAAVAGLTLLPVLSEATAIRAELARQHEPELLHLAEERLSPALSCRNWTEDRVRRRLILSIVFAAALFGVLWAPWFAYQVISWAALGLMMVSMGLKVVAAGAQLLAERRAAGLPAKTEVTPLRLPRVSVMVPLLRETEIAERLVQRLSRLTYPKPLLDIILVLEAEDALTRQTLKRCNLPPWMRVIEVPAGPNGLTTKPRAMNYALDFCESDIVGIWDAEDAPEPDQIEVVVGRFHAAGPEVACLQGCLDYYKSRTNWISRCFTIEYATWWRLVVPGLARLGMVIPLGGTTLFFRRAVLEKLERWDAHNVTEDADLGIRLARAGYRTEMIDTTTFEEPNCRMWPWTKQRSRWLKGFAITWATHMRAPRRLLQDLGLYRFLGVQLLFLTALGGFILAPVMWSFWLIAAGVIPSPFGSVLGGAVLPAFLIGFELCLGLHLLAVNRDHQRHLMLWTPLMTLYFLMATVAVYKALYELMTCPFYWHKTQHGVAQPAIGGPWKWFRT